MNCPTCGFLIDGPARFCPHCGWPAGRLAVELAGDALGLPQDGEASVPLVLKNVGAGPVEYAISVADGQPWAYLLVGGRRQLPHVGDRRLPHGGTDNSLALGVRAAEVPADAVQILLDIESTDRHSVPGSQSRPWEVEQYRSRRWQIRVPIRRLGPARLYVGSRLCLFTTHQRSVPVRVRNTGGSTAHPVFETTHPGIRLAWEGLSPLEQPLIASGAETRLVVSAADDFEGPAGVAVWAEDGVRHELLLYGEPAQQSASLVKHWTMGIDFGTSKSAVYYTDNWVPVEERSPRPITWPVGPSATERTVTTTRSALMFRGGSDAPLCGHEVLVEAGAEASDNELVVDAMKTRLRPHTTQGDVVLPSGKQETPVNLVAHFMRYLLDEVRGSEPFRGNPDLDARYVLTLPVMPQREDFLSQRDSTLRAAAMAGLRVGDDLLTPSEPECAALDLMHSLRRGDYSFGGQPYHLQDGELLLVLDCGAGTTDVAVLRVSLSNGTFGVDHVAAAGYPFGGDVVDDLLLSYLLDESAESARFGWRGRRAMLHLEGLSQPIPIHRARAECRRIKESLFVEEASDGPRHFRTDLGTYQLAPGHVERLVAPFLETMFTAGVIPDPAAFFPRLDAKLDDELRRALWRELATNRATQVRPLAQALREANVARSDVTFLFVTGGTGQVPIVASRLYDFMGRSARIVVASPDDCTVNVARGASLLYEYKISGVLRCGIDIVGMDPETGAELFREKACAPGALPGPQLQRTARLGPRSSIELGLWATYPGAGPSGLIAGARAYNPSPEPRDVTIHTAYGSDRTLTWRVVFADGEVLVDAEPVLRI